MGRNAGSTPRLVVKAGEFAVHAHGQQARKDRRTPYFVHPIGVMRFLASELGVTDTDILCAALLHDVLEDTTTSPAVLTRRFGPKIAHIVEELTVPKEYHGPWVPDRRKTAVLVDAIGRMSWEAVVVKLADRYDNLLDMANAQWGTVKKRSYRDQTREILAALGRRMQGETPPRRLAEPIRRARASVRSRLAVAPR
ncbi:MAG: HD domain-containing protein [Thermoplasmata archaeon]